MFLIGAHFNGRMNGTVMLLIGAYCNNPPMNEWYRNVPNKGAL